jgi:hypothetical protein
MEKQGPVEQQRILQRLVSDPASFSPDDLGLVQAPEIFTCLARSWKSEEKLRICEGVQITHLGGDKSKVGTLLLATFPDGQKLVIKTMEVRPSITYRKVGLDGAPTDATRGCFVGAEEHPTTAELACDRFTNETLIAYYLNVVHSALEDPTIPCFFVRHITAAVIPTSLHFPRPEMLPTRLQGFNLMELADLGSLAASFDPESSFRAHVRDQPRGLLKAGLVRKVLSQLVVGLHHLQSTIGFTHSDCKLANVVVASVPVHYTYRGVILRAPFTCRFADYGISSATLPFVDGKDKAWLRIKVARDGLTKCLDVLPYLPTVVKTRDGIQGVVPRGRIENVQARNLYQRYYRAYDTASIMVGVLRVPAAGVTFFKNKNLVDAFFEATFPDPQGQQLLLNRLHKRWEEWMERYREGDEHMDLVRILDGITIRCDAQEEILRRLETLQCSVDFHAGRRFC